MVCYRTGRGHLQPCDLGASVPDATGESITVSEWAYRRRTAGDLERNRRLVRAPNDVRPLDADLT